MNSRERVIAALQRQEPDRVPIAEWEIDYRVIKAISSESDYPDFVENYGIDVVCVYEDVEFKDISPTTKLDQFGIVRDFRGEVPMFWPMPVEGPIKSGKDLEKYVPPNPHDPRRLASLQKMVKRFKGKKAIALIVFDSFLFAAFLRGMENFLADYIINPDFARKVAEIVNNYYIELARQAIRAGADIIVCGDDYCGKEGPFMSPEHFKKFILPGLKKMVHAVKEEGGYFVKHCDGYVWPIMDMLVDAGIDAYNPIQPDASLDIAEMKRVYGDKICLIGNIDCAHLLPFGTPDQVDEAVRRCIAQASPGGGHIISSSNTIHSKVKPENFLSMIQAVKKYGQYPLEV